MIRKLVFIGGVELDPSDVNQMELFHPFPVIRSKNFFYKNIPNWSKDFNVDFKNRKWNCLNRKRNHFSPFQSSDQKTFLTLNILLDKIYLS